MFWVLACAWLEEGFVQPQAKKSSQTMNSGKIRGDEVEAAFWECLFINCTIVWAIIILWNILLENLINYWLLIDSGDIRKPKDLEQYIFTSEDGSMFCGICQQTQNRRDHLREHIEAKHFPNIFTYQCSQCSFVVGSKKALYNHNQRAHPKNKLMFQ